jgi:proteasome lid subunit RPN8/RPN11
MDDIKEIAFVAIITINLPDDKQATKLRVRLMPSDTVKTSSGTLKQLQDCTLGELSQFADSLEAEVLSRYRSSTLVDMTLDGQVDITLDYQGDDRDQIPPSELWLEHIVLLPQTEETLADEALAESTEEILAGLDKDQPDEQPSLPAEDLVEEKAEEILVPDQEVEEQEIADEVETEAEPFVTVAEAEPIHKEREADQAEVPAEAVETIERVKKVRILGRRRPLNHPTWTAVDILINESAFRDAQAHALMSLDREVAGVLVGPPPEKQPDGRYVVHVSDTIIAKYTRMHGASVTYTPESWRYVNDKLAARYPNDEAVIVGWYHTHPGFGIFLSGMDQFIHQNFFTQKWHIAFVLDPVARRSGFFCWDREGSQVDAYEFPWPNWAAGSW